jgi:hypothetical protein
MSALYLFLFNRERLYSFLLKLLSPIVVYAALRINAVGLHQNVNIAPIDRLSVGGRLLTDPSIVMLYLSKLIFPWRLATGYYWVHSTFSVRYVLLPLLIDLIVVGLFIYVGFLVHKRSSKAQYYTYLFFAIWAGVGMLPNLQIIPLDLTAAETWFYFSFVGVLGMIGVALGAFRIRPTWIVIAGVVLIGVFGIRTALRGFDYRSQYRIDNKDIAAAQDNYTAYYDLSSYYFEAGEYNKAETSALASVKIFPSFYNYYNLGVILTHFGDYQQAETAYGLAFEHGSNKQIYEAIGELTLAYGNPSVNKQILLKGVAQYPKDVYLWVDLAIAENKNNDNKDARAALARATLYGNVPKSIYDSIYNDQLFTTTIPNIGSVTIP